MNKVTAVKVASRIYFAGAVIFSAKHVYTAWTKLGLDSTEAIAATAAIDLMFLVAMILRSDDFASHTRKLGFRTMLVMGAMSLAGNVYGSHSLGGIIFGAMMPGFLLFAEHLLSKGVIETAQAEADALALKAAQDAIANAAQQAADKKAAAIAKGQATRARKARAAKQEAKALENMLSR